MKTKRCGKCDTVKLVSKFYINTKSKDGLNNICIDCTKQRNKERDHKLNNLVARFGINKFQYLELLEKQNGVCAICGRHETIHDKHSTAIKLLCVDHDHKTHKIRGLLCNKCNVSLGNFNDDPKY